MDNDFIIMNKNQILLDRVSKAEVDAHIYVMNAYEEQIRYLKDKITNEIIKATSFIASKLETIDGINEYKHLGAMVVCEGFTFVYSIDEKFHYIGESSLTGRFCDNSTETAKKVVG